jgi:elongation factor 1-alpha
MAEVTSIDNRSDPNKKHISIAVCGHVDSGKSTTTGHLIFELGGLDARTLEKLQQEANTLGKSSFAFAFFMDRCKEERARGLTIQCTLKEFFTPSWHYTIIDAPGHRDFIKNMITGASQADVALLLVPADGNFTVAITKGNHKAGEIQGQTRQHARLLNLLGVKQLIVDVNKMDCDVANYSKARFDEIAEEMRGMLQRVGCKKEFVETSVPIIPTSGLLGENLITKSDKMPWWTGVEVERLDKEKCHVTTIHDALERFVILPQRCPDKPMRMPVSGLYKIKGVGDVITGRIEQGIVRPKDEVCFLPTHTASNTCAGTVFSLEMHHTKIDEARPGDNVGINMKGLLKQNMPHTGDVMIFTKDQTLRASGQFTAQVQILDIPGEIKVNYAPTVFVRTGHSSCRITRINWKMGKETSGKKVENPEEGEPVVKSLKSNEMAEVVFKPIQPLVVDIFQNCEGLSRLAVMEGNGVVMLGKCVKTEAREDIREEAKKKEKEPGAKPAAKPAPKGKK